eukprot:2786007-Pyramimonas_sp.AAC.1
MFGGCLERNRKKSASVVPKCAPYPIIDVDHRQKVHAKGASRHPRARVVARTRQIRSKICAAVTMSKPNAQQKTRIRDVR